MGFDTVLFDLDGTISDPALGITNAIIYALEQLGEPHGPNSDYYRFIGPPMPESYSEYLGFSPERARRALEEYRVYFGERGLFENELYPGMRELLMQLRDAGRRVLLATSKPQPFTERIIDYFGLRDAFTFIAGSELHGGRHTKGDVIAYALAAGGVTDRSRAIMVGDREHDVLGAHENGLPCVGVLFGYGSERELRDAGAEYIAADMAELRDILLPSR